MVFSGKRQHEVVKSIDLKVNSAEDSSESDSDDDYITDNSKSPTSRSPPMFSCFAEDTSQLSNTDGDESDEAPRSSNMFSCLAEDTSQRSIIAEEETDGTDEDSTEENNASHINEQSTPIEQLIHRRKVTKEVTIMNIGSKSKGQFRIKGVQRVPYRVADMCANKNPGLNGRQSKQRYRVENPKNGGMFQRIKPRPVLMAASRFPVNTNTSTVCQMKLEDKIQDKQDDEIYLESTHADDVSLLSSPATPPRAYEEVPSSLEKRVNAEQDITTGHRLKIVPQWRKLNKATAIVSPKENIDTVEVEYTEETRLGPSLPVQRKISFGRSPSLPKKNNVTMDTLNVIVEKSEIDQNDAGRPLTLEEMKRMEKAQEQNFSANKRLGHTLRKTTQGFLKPLQALSKSLSADTHNLTDSKRIERQPYDEAVQTETILNKDGTVPNQKVVYNQHGGVAKENMKLVRADEDLVPDQDSSDILLQVEVSTKSSKSCICTICIPFVFTNSPLFTKRDE